MKTARFTYHDAKYEVSYEDDLPRLVILPDDTLLALRVKIGPEPARMPFIEAEPVSYGRATYEVGF